MLTVLLFGCSPQSSSVQLSTADGIYPVDPIFEDFYTDLGGSEYLGPAISQVFERSGSQCQYTINSLMCFNPNVTGLSRYQLAPLGLELEIQDAPRSIPGINSPRIVDGYSIYPEFIEAYDTLFGALHVGAPLTNPIYNEDQDGLSSILKIWVFTKTAVIPTEKFIFWNTGLIYVTRTAVFLLEVLLSKILTLAMIRNHYLVWELNIWVVHKYLGNPSVIFIWLLMEIMNRFMKTWFFSPNRKTPVMCSCESCPAY